MVELRLISSVLLGLLATPGQDEPEITRAVRLRQTIVLFTTDRPLERPRATLDHEETPILFAEGAILILDVNSERSRMSLTDQGKPSPEFTLSRTSSLVSVESIPGVTIRRDSSGDHVVNQGSARVVGVLFDEKEPGTRSTFRSAAVVLPGSSCDFIVPPLAVLVLVSPETASGITIPGPRISPSSEAADGELRFNTHPPQLQGLGIRVTGELGGSLAMSLPDHTLDFGFGNRVVHHYQRQDLSGVGAGVDANVQLVSVRAQVMFGTATGRGTLHLIEGGIPTAEGDSTFRLHQIVDVGLSVYWPALHYGRSDVDLGLGPIAGLHFVSENVEHVDSPLIQSLPPGVDLSQHLNPIAGQAGVRLSASAKVAESLRLSAGVELQFLFGKLGGTLFQGDAGLEILF
jgi:hypothetical protein